VYVGSDKSAVVDDDGNVHADVMEAIEKAWEVGFSSIEEANAAHIRYGKFRDRNMKIYCVQPLSNKVDLKWHLEFIRRNILTPPKYVKIYYQPFTLTKRIRYFFRGIKQFFLLMLMNKDEKDLYINGYSWRPSHFFKMKKKADKLEKEGRINIRSNSK
jgi:hypothetical protein